MSLFKSKGIVLKKKKLWEKEFLYTLFSYDFWKIDVVKKLSSKEKALDIGYDINFEIKHAKKNGISSIANIKILSEFDVKEKDFKTIQEYLWLIFRIYTKTEKNIPVYEIYNIINILNKKDITREKICLTELKLVDIFWELPENHSDETVRKIFLFIRNNNIKDILRLSGIDDEKLTILQQIYSADPS
jgi:hypothetical protein